MSERKFGFEPAAGSLSEIVRLGALAEKHGFDVVWISDHLVDLRPLGGFKADAWSILAYIASMTSRIRLAPGVTDVYRCHPAQTANRVATLDELTAGRVMLGIGAGEAMNIAPYGIEWERARIRRERLIEAVKIIKLLWTSNRDSPAHYDGKYYQLKNAWLDQLPTQNPHPPIYVGAFRSPKLLHAIGETADGWLSSSFSNTPEIFRKRRQIIEEAAKGVGRDPRNLDYVAKFHV
ncbi:MAG: LLM class flavin-dependent oxidoreductase, partial [Candidatus Bathyarchaeia archaeon]